MRLHVAHNCTPMLSSKCSTTNQVGDINNTQIQVVNDKSQASLLKWVWSQVTSVDKVNVTVLDYMSLMKDASLGIQYKSNYMSLQIENMKL